LQVAALEIVHAPQDEDFVLSDAVGDGVDFEPTAEDLSVRTFRRHRGGANELQMFEISYPANITVTPHAHEADEIIFVTKGELRFGRQICPVGTSVFIKGMTLYSFRTGSEGAIFLNFRAHRDFTIFSKTQVVAAQRATRESNSL
jgi:hypothetical protein